MSGNSAGFTGGILCGGTTACELAVSTHLALVSGWFSGWISNGRWKPDSLTHTHTHQAKKDNQSFENSGLE